MYQLLDYQTNRNEHDLRRQRGRRFTIRFGHIGLAWRLKQDQYSPNVRTIIERIKNWGMTEEEAKDMAKDRKSFASIIITNANESVGVLYIDVNVENFLGDTEAEGKEKCLEIAQALDSSEIPAILHKIKNETFEDAPRIRIIQK